MNTVVRLTAFIGSIAALGTAVYVFIGNLNVRKMRKENRKLGVYIKDKKYLLMKNDGEDPCSTKKIDMPLFSQNGEYIIRRKYL